MDVITQEIIDFIYDADAEWQFDVAFEDLYDNCLELLEKLESGQELTEQETNWVLFCYDDIKYNN